MSTESLNHLRVVVKINVFDHDDDHEHTENFDKNKTTTSDKISNRSCGQKRKNAGDSNMKAEVLVIDDKTLQMNLLSTDEIPYTNISHKMHFDHIDRNSVDLIKSELSLVMDDLLVKKRNVCIMRFSNKHEMDSEVFYKHLVNFTNKRLYYQKFALQNVEIEYVNISVASLNNSNSSTGDEPVESYLAGLEGAGGNTTFEVSPYQTCTKKQFRSTEDMLSWLLSNHRQIEPDLKIHQKFQITLCILDSRRKNIFNVKLHLFNIHLNFMDSEDRNHWHLYMDHMGEACSDPDCNFMHTGLTISLSGHIEPVASETSLLMFNVPNDPERPGDTVEILQMAHAAIKNRKKRQVDELNTRNLDRRMSIYAGDSSKSRIDSIKLPHPLQSTDQRATTTKTIDGNSLPIHNNKERRLTMPTTTTNPGSVSFTIPVGSQKNFNPNKSPVRPTDGDSFSRQHLNKLSAWYRKIDDHFITVCTLREKYYKRYFNLHTKLLLHSFESMSIQQYLNEDLRLRDEDKTELSELFEKYRKAECVFRFLYNRIHNTIYEDILKVYLDTKVFQLNQNSVDLKLKQLDACEKRINFVLDYAFDI